MSSSYTQTQKQNSQLFNTLTSAQQKELRSRGYNNRGKENVARSHQLITEYCNQIVEESCQKVMEAMERTDAVVAELQKGYVPKNNVIPVTVARLGLTGGKLVLPRDTRPLKDIHCPTDTIVPVRIVRLHGENIILKRYQR